MTTTETAEARARIERYIAAYEDAPNWGGPTIYLAAPKIADLRALLNASLTPPAQGGEWRDIASAPYDRTVLIDDRRFEEVCEAIQYRTEGWRAFGANGPMFCQPIAWREKPQRSAIPDTSLGSASAPTAERLRSALEPFARAAEWWKAFDDQHRITSLHQYGDCLEVRHLREARAALSDAGEGSGVADAASVAGSKDAIAHLQIRSPLNRAIYKAIREYRMGNMADEDGYAYPLVDLMSNPAPSDIGTGEMEMIALADEVCSAVEALAAPASDGLRAALERAENDLHLVTLHGDVVGMHREAMAAKKRVRAALDQPQSGEGGE